MRVVSMLALVTLTLETQPMTNEPNRDHKFSLDSMPTSELGMAKLIMIPVGLDCRNNKLQEMKQ